MSTPAASHLSELLAELDRDLAEPAMGPLQRFIGASATSPNLVVALVGPSGTGKSALFNILAGADIAVEGALRPTTKDPEVWPIGSRGLILIDTPPFELDPEAVGHALDRTDLAIIVITPDRYADAVVRDLTNELERRGVPNVVALNRVPGDPALAAAITVDVIASLEGDLTIVPEAKDGDLDGSMLRDRIAGIGRSEMVARRDLGAAVFIDDQVEIIAQRVEDRDRHVEQVLDAAERSFADARIDRARLAAAARLSWPLASKTLLDTVADSTTRAIEAVVKDPALDPGLAGMVREAAAAAGPLDPAPLESWNRRVTEAAMAQLQRPALRPLQRRAIQKDAWRLAADLAMVPDRRIRTALGDQVADLRMVGNQALTLALRDAAEERIEQFMAGLGKPSTVPADELREASAALLDETEGRTGSVLSKADTDG